MNTKEITELIEKIIKNRFENIDLQKELCEELYDEGTRQNNDELIGTALFYRAEAILYESSVDSEADIRKSIKYLNKSKCNELLARAYNLLGIIASNKEDLSVSLESYLNCYEICQQNHFDHIQGLCSSNIGVIFQLLESYKEATAYYKDAIDSFHKEAEDVFHISNVICLTVNIFKCSFKLKDIAQMEESLKLLRENKDYVEPSFCIDLFEAVYCNQMSEKEKSRELLSKAVEQCLLDENVVEDIDIYQFICEYLFESKMYDELMKVLELVEHELPDKSFPRIRIVLLKYRLFCLLEKRDFDEYARWTQVYIKTYEQITENYHQTVLDSVNLRLYVAKLKDKESEYKKNALTDSLTQLNNRSGFIKYGNRLLNKAVKKRTAISLFIIDIDYFKQINDFYGHAYGDECLKKIAEVLNGLQSDNIIAGRYGGDEFVMICYGVAYEDIQKLSKEVHKKVQDMMIKSEKSPISDYVTLSMGIHHIVPDSSDTLMSLITMADKALYTVKSNGRNSFLIN